MKRRTYVALMLLVILLLASGFTAILCRKDMANQKQNQGEGQYLIVTSFYPMYVAAMNIAGDIEGVSVENLSEPQTGCLHDFQMTPEDMRLLSTADAFIVNGCGMESFMEEVAEAYPNLTIITAADGVSDLSLLDEDADDHADDDDHDDDDHDHGDVNGHLWMNVSYMEQVVSHIAVELASADPAHAGEYAAGAEAYLDKLSALEIEELRELTQGTNVVVFHEAYEILAEELGMNVVYCLDLDEERQISAGEVADVLEAIEAYDVKMVLAEETYGSDMGRLISQSSDVCVLYINPLTRAVDGISDLNYYLECMTKNLNLIKDELK